jgi:hypothetical protein
MLLTEREFNPKSKTNNTACGLNAMIGVATAHCEMSLDMDDLVTMKPSYSSHQRYP